MATKKMTVKMVRAERGLTPASVKTAFSMVREDSAFARALMQMMTDKVMEAQSASLEPGLSEAELRWNAGYSAGLLEQMAEMQDTWQAIREKEEAK